MFDLRQLGAIEQLRKIRNSMHMKLEELPHPRVLLHQHLRRAGTPEPRANQSQYVADIVQYDCREKGTEDSYAPHFGH